MVDFGPNAVPSKLSLTAQQQGTKSDPYLVSKTQVDILPGKNFRVGVSATVADSTEEFRYVYAKCYWYCVSIHLDVIRAMPLTARKCYNGDEGMEQQSSFYHPSICRDRVFADHTRNMCNCSAIAKIFDGEKGNNSNSINNSNNSSLPLCGPLGVRCYVGLIRRIALTTNAVGRECIRPCDEKIYEVSLKVRKTVGITEHK